MSQETRRWITAAACLIGSVIAASPIFAQTTLVSTAADGTQANGPSTHAALSANRRYVAFTSAATNLVPGDTNGRSDVFVKDLQTNAITRVSVATGGAEFPFDSGFDGVDISADGNIVVFTSDAPFAADDTNTCGAPAAPCADVYVHDRSSGTTTRVSVATGGGQGNNASVTPRLSDDGRYVVFASAASTLVASDTNTVSDIFLHDRTTQVTTRVSESATGTQGDGESRRPTISDDGAVIGFVSNARSFTVVPDPFPCNPAAGNCARAFLRTRATGETMRIDPTDWTQSGTPEFDGMFALELDATGTKVAMVSAGYFPVCCRASILRFDRQSQRTTRRYAGAQFGGPIALSGDGRFMAYELSDEQFQRPLTIADGALNQLEVVGLGGLLDTPRSTWRPSLSFDGRYLVYSTIAKVAAGDTNTIRDIVMLDRDRDGDGAFTAWEQDFGLNPDDAADAAGDPDGDGRTSLQEFQAGTNPKGLHTRYLAEGAANAFFATTISIANPNTATTLATVRLLGGNGKVETIVRTVPPLGHTNVELSAGGLVPDQAFGAVIESTLPVVVERTMAWDVEMKDFFTPSFIGYGAHAEAAASSPSMNWFLAEGATHGSFDLFYLLQNPSPLPAQVTVTYLREFPLAPLVKPYTVEANSRLTIYVDTELPELAAANVSASIASTQPIMVERAMYSSQPGQTFTAGHAGAGVTAPAMKWYLAEGATGSFFDLYLLVANPGTQSANVQVTYLLPAGAPIVKTYTANRQSRLTIGVDFEHPLLADTPVGMIVESTNGQPIVVERAMWWPSPNWYEAHLVAGATTTGTRWGVAGGSVVYPSVGTAAPIETYILIANTSSTAGTATVTLLGDFPGSRPTRTFPLQPNSRVNVPLGETFELDGGGRVGIGVLVETNGVEIVVERATYTTFNGVTWSAGTATVATRLDP